MRRRQILGTEVAITDYSSVLTAIEAAIDTDRRIYICCAPASTLVAAGSDPALAAALADAEIVTPDGMGVVHAARLLGEKIKDRVYGPDLMQLQLARSAAESIPVFLYGGHDQAALAQLETALRRAHPNLPIAGTHSPPHRPLSDDEAATIAEQINRSGAKIVWVGIGSPKQEIWMHRTRGRLDAPVLVGVGAAFDFHAGRVAQAPAWMQRAGLEWLFRIFQDPLRLGRRYLATLPRFVAMVAAQAVRERTFR